MSNKRFDRLIPQEHRLRRTLGLGMQGGATETQYETLLTIEFVSGFEAFNTRPYHNYETWGQGWRITDAHGRKVLAEDLDAALDRYCDLVDEART